MRLPVTESPETSQMSCSLKEGSHSEKIAARRCGCSLLCYTLLLRAITEKIVHALYLHLSQRVQVQVSSITSSNQCAACAPEPLL